jgi:hypothetical protein
MILQRVEPSLCNDHEISNYTRAVSRQRLGKHIPAATDTHATIEVLLETVFSSLTAQRGYKEDGREPPFRVDESPEVDD